jgi:outer membrane protein assembly factor BamD (BamD/ComL family)
MKPRLLLIACLVLLPAVLAVAQTVPTDLAEGLRSFQDNEFDQALESFRAAALQAGPYQGHSQFWYARTLMALGRYDEAADAFDLLLGLFQDHPYTEEATYQRARLFFIDGDYDIAIQRFGDFLEEYPTSDFAANAIYWTAEALFATGHLDEAKRLFQEVTERYPTSYRVEAARYRQDIIDFTRRENELLTLLQWSHEEYLSALEQFQQRERAYQEALQSYRQRLTDLGSEDFQAELDALNSEIADLTATVAERDARIAELEAQLRLGGVGAETPEVVDDAAGSQETTPGEQADDELTQELLQLREQALLLQQELQRMADEELGGEEE